MSHSGQTGSQVGIKPDLSDDEILSSELFERFLRDFPEAAIAIDSDDNVVWFNAVAARALPVMSGASVHGITDPGSHGKLESTLQRVRNGEDVVTELVLVVDGRPALYSIHFFTHLGLVVLLARGSSDDAGRFLEMSSMLSDFATLYRESSHQRMELEHQGQLLEDLARELESERKRLLTIIDQLPEAIILVRDDSGEILLTNERVQEFWQLDAAPATLDEIPLRVSESNPIAPLETPVIEALRRRTDVGPYELLIVPADESTITVQALASPIIDDNGSTIGAAMSLVDITEQQRLREELASQAVQDPLTGLGNRRMFFRAVDAALASTSESIAVLYLDLDGFKAINDSLGHDAGDETLLEIAARLRHAVRDDDTIARIGGDEFSILLEGVGNHESVELVVRRILDAISATMVVHDQTIRLTGSIGICFVEPDSNVSTSEIVSRADMAMYQAKTADTARWSYYHDGLADSAFFPVTLAEEIHHALDNEQFEMLYRPVVEVASGRVREVEIALFWRHMRDGLLDDEEIRSRAWRAGLLHAIAERAAQLGSYDRPLMIEAMGARNDIVLSRHYWLEYLREQRVVDQLVDIASSVAGSQIRVRLELSGRLHRGDDAMMRSLWRLHESGLELSVAHAGDFDGEFALLRHIPMHSIVAAPSLVQAPQHDPLAETTLGTIVQIADHFGVCSKAPGIETDYQLQRAREAGFHFVSGSQYGEPQTATELRERTFEQIFPIDT